MQNKEIHYPYYCKKCTRTVYFGENDIINDTCKICGNKMEKENPIISHPKDAIKNVNRKGSYSTKSFQQQTKPIPKCPTCQSTNIRKIGALESGASILTLGIFSKKINKTFKCNNCGYMW